MWFSCDCAPQAQSQNYQCLMNDAGLQVRTVAGAQFWERIAKICGPLIWENPSVNTHTSNPIIYTLKSVWMPPVLPRASFWLDVGVLRQTLIITLAQRRICRVAFNIPLVKLDPAIPSTSTTSTLRQSSHYKGSKCFSKHRNGDVTSDRCVFSPRIIEVELKSSLNQIFITVTHYCSETCFKRTPGTCQWQSN